MDYFYYIRNMKKILIGMLATTLLCGCTKKNIENVNNPEDSGNEAVSVSAVALGYKGSKPVNAIPRATAFRMSGDYADNVAVTVINGNITYFPAPSDISDQSRPVSLGNGWWLNRQGISQLSVFTRYTFAEYAELKQVPSVAELKAAIIPGARVTEMYTLPYTINEAPEHLEEIRSILSGKE